MEFLSYRLPRSGGAEPGAGDVVDFGGGLYNHGVQEFFVLLDLAQDRYSPLQLSDSLAQSVIRLLEEERNVPYYVSEEREVDGKELNTEKAAFTAGVVRPWYSDDARNSALAGKENAIARLLNDILKTSKHPWSRFKKGGLRSCFGVRLERIGSFSGLGC
ncbi:C-type natriuretic peptide prohormone-like [Salvelinus alpinus]